MIPPGGRATASLSTVLRRLAWLAVLVAAGCGRAARVPVEGVVTLDGSPVAAASVTFVPVAGGRPGAAVTDAAGRFSIWEGGSRPGLPRGRYAVSVFKVTYAPAPTRLVREPGPPPLDGSPPKLVEQPAADRQIERYVVPERYLDARSSGLEVDVSRASRDLKLDLTTK